MTVNNQENTAIFDGAVVLTRGPLVVHSDHMVVSFHPSRNGADGKESGGPTKSKNLTNPTTAESKERDAAPAVSERSIRMVEATGRVNIKKEDGQATCQKAVYYEEQKKIVLTGEPVAWQKDISRYFSAEVRIEAENKIGMLASISAAIAGTGTNIGHATVEQRDGEVSLIKLEVEVKDRKHLARVVRTIRSMPEVLRVSRYQASRRSQHEE